MRKDAKIIKVLVLIYSSFKSPRLFYVLNYLFSQRLGLEYRVLEKLESTDLEETIHISYGETVKKGALHFKADRLLKESEISKTTGGFRYADPYNCADPFAFIFFHLSRYEEYICSERDQHDRFKAGDSVLYHKDAESLLYFPVVDTLVLQLAENIGKVLDREIKPLGSHLPMVCPSIDIDSVFAYKGRPLYRHLAAMAKDAFSLRFPEIRKRLAVIGNRVKDPNDNFDYQFEVLGNKKAVYFIQCGPYGAYDKNISLDNADFKAVLNDIISRGHEIAIHPSYGSDSRPDRIRQEKELLENTLNIRITKSRQHFLKMRLPETYRSLIACGIESDWTMGYSEESGFRAGTAFPFDWYDLEKDSPTSLQIVPFCFMDVVFKQFKQMNTEQCLQLTLPMRSNLIKNNLPFVFVFHNESLSRHRGWQGWEKVFEKWVNG